MKHYVKVLLALPPLLLCAGVLLLHPKQNTTPIPAGEEADRLAWLETQGLSCRHISTAEVVIPQHMEGNYADYAALQEQLGLPLASHSGEAGMLYTYYVKDSDPPLYAELLTAEGVLIGAQCYCPEESMTLDMEGNVFQAPSA